MASGIPSWPRVAAAATFGYLWVVLLVLSLRSMLEMEVQKTDQLEAMLESLKESSLSRSVCGGRPPLDSSFPLSTRRRFMEYNDCLAHYLARPSLLSATVYIIPIIVAILVVFLYMMRHTQPLMQPSSHKHVLQAFVC